jgi:predicted dehydrogenase
MTKPRPITRREAIRRTLSGAAALVAAPTILPSSVFARPAPSDLIAIGQVGAGRIARDHDLPETMKHRDVRVVAVCDVDHRRMAEGKAFIEERYAREWGAPSVVDVRMEPDYREIARRDDIDAVVISTPDHQHFLPALGAALAGKDIYMQKPLSLTIEEGRILSDVCHRMGTVFQVGSQQRSQAPWPQFHRACELVRNGRIGALHTVRIGLPGDPAGGDPTPMPVPDGLDYDMWLGSTPVVPYTVDRVHPVDGYGRGGWLRCEQFSAGMITGWGAHHIDTAHWGMGAEHTGPIEIRAEAEFPTQGLWDVHGPFRVEALYAGGVRMLISGEFPNGVRFEGEDGWIFVTRGAAQVTASDPVTGGGEPALQAGDPAILDSVVGPDEIHLVRSEEQHTNWIRCIRTRAQTVAPVEVAHRSCSACLVSHIAMKLPGTLYWDPVTERFRDNDQANAMRSRPQRHPYTLDLIPGLR